MDFCLSLLALIVLSPVLVILTVIGFFAMGGNPFFAQARPGKKDKNGKERERRAKMGVRIPTIY